MFDEYLSLKLNRTSRLTRMLEYKKSRWCRKPAGDSDICRCRQTCCTLLLFFLRSCIKPILFAIRRYKPFYFGGRRCSVLFARFFESFQHFLSKVQGKAYIMSEDMLFCAGSPFLLSLHFLRFKDKMIAITERMILISKRI